MDAQFKALLESDEAPSADAKAIQAQIRVIDPVTGEVELLHGEDDPAPRRYTLKPLSELYGQDKPDASADPQSEHCLSLLLTIEQHVVHCYRLNPSLSDGAVRLSLDLLAMSPESNVQHDSLASGIQSQLRLLLSFNDYSRVEVRHALRKVRKSVERHTRSGGQRAYLDFISEYVPT
jgi:hypothetical protein